MFTISSLCRWHSSWRKQRGCTSASLRIGSSSSRPHPAPRSPTGKWSMMVPHGPSSALVGGKNDIYVDKMKFYISITMTTITPDKLYLPQLDVPCLSLAPRFPHHYVPKWNSMFILLWNISKNSLSSVWGIYKAPQSWFYHRLFLLEAPPMKNLGYVVCWGSLMWDMWLTCGTLAVWLHGRAVVLDGL